MSMDLEITIGGRWLSLECPYGDVQMSTVFPGGSDQLLFTPGTLTSRRWTPGTDVRAYYGPVCVWAGDLPEPDPSTDQIAAIGAWQEASCPALDGAGNATKIPDTAVGAAIANGFLNWSIPASLSSSAVDVDVSQGPLTVGELLDKWALDNNVYWYVDPYRRVRFRAADTGPTWVTDPINGTLGFDLTNYASQLVGRFYNGTSYDTVIVDGPGGHGSVQKVVDLTGRGTLTATKARNILTNLFAQAMAVPNYTESVGFSYGELRTKGGTAVALETAAAGHTLRIHTGFDLPQRLNNQLYADVPIGRTVLTGGLLTLQPQQVAVTNLADYVASTSAKHHAA